MNEINFYKEKYYALDNFYCWVDQGSSYQVAVGQSFYYNKKMNEMQELIIAVTIATRFARCGRTIDSEFREYLGEVIVKGEILDFAAYGLTDAEQKVLNEEIREIKLCIGI